MFSLGYPPPSPLPLPLTPPPPPHTFPTPGEFILSTSPPYPVPLRHPKPPTVILGSSLTFILSSPARPRPYRPHNDTIIRGVRACPRSSRIIATPRPLQFNRLVDLLFLFDMVIAFHVAYPENVAGTTVWVMRRDLIRRHYLFGWFIIDFLSVLPL